MPCKLCGNHMNKNVCLRCNDCDHAHVMKFGFDWKEDMKEPTEPCPHIARFQLPNNQWVQFPCVKKKHQGECDFGDIKKQVEKMAEGVSRN